MPAVLQDLELLTAPLNHWQVVLTSVAIRHVGQIRTAAGCCLGECIEGTNKERSHIFSTYSLSTITSNAYLYFRIGITASTTCVPVPGTPGLLPGNPTTFPTLAVIP